MKSSITLHNVIKMSAAGSGKTYDICKEALTLAGKGERVLITTYTIRGVGAVKSEIRKQNDGVLNPHIVVKSWYSFIMADMIKPYQLYLTDEVNAIKGYDFSNTYGKINYKKIGTRERYITRANNVKSNEAASLACKLNELSGGKVVRRLEEVYKAIYFDEIQDLAGDDITIMQNLMESDIDVICCGDSKQATYSTHNSRKNKNKTGKNIWIFFSDLEKRGLVQIEKNLKSRRFNRQICNFANKVFPVGDSISTIMDEVTEHDGVFLIDKSDVDEYQDMYSAQVLRYSCSTYIDKYDAVNYGTCKGETFDRVMIFPNGPFEKFILNGKPLSSPEKYYVAVTRPRYSIVFVMEFLPKNVKGYEESLIGCKKKAIRALKYVPF